MGDGTRIPPTNRCARLLTVMGLGMTGGGAGISITIKAAQDHRTSHSAVLLATGTTGILFESGGYAAYRFWRDCRIPRNPPPQFRVIDGENHEPLKRPHDFRARHPMRLDGRPSDHRPAGPRQLPEYKIFPQPLVVPELHPLYSSWDAVPSEPLIAKWQWGSLGAAAALGAILVTGGTVAPALMPALAL